MATGRNKTVGSTADIANTTMFFCTQTPTSDPQQAINFQYECAYNDYLQNLVKKKILMRAIDDHNTAINDQLSIQHAKLDSLNREIKKLECEAKKAELRSQIGNVHDVLAKMLDGIREILKPNVVTELDNLTVHLTKTRDRLYSKNVEPFESQEMYDCFENVMWDCHRTLKKLNGTCGDLECLQKLSDCIGIYKQLVTKLQKQELDLFDLQENVVLSTLKTCSEMFPGAKTLTCCKLKFRCT